MIKLGMIQYLQVVKKTSSGILLSSRENPEEEVLLPKGQAAPDLEESDEIEVFVYKDSQGRLTATTQKPKITLDEVASLQVKDVTNIGAFLDWGLPKDLLLPYREQRVRVRKGKEYLVGLYKDKSGRLCATMQIYNYLRTDSPYKTGDRVSGIVYDLENDIGALVAVDKKYSALIPKAEEIGGIKSGDIIEARVVRVREDGKLDLSLKERPDKQIENDARTIVARLQEKGGTLPLQDNSSPEQIRTELGISKAAFKRAVGRLLKEKTINLGVEGIELAEEEPI